MQSWKFPKMPLKVETSVVFKNISAMKKKGAGNKDLRHPHVQTWKTHATL